MESFKSLWDHIMKLVYIAEKVRVLLNIWALRISVLSSLLYQIAMVLSAYKRKHTSCEVSSSLRSSYLKVDVIASTALGIATRDYGNDSDSKHGLYLVWAMCLVLHLGGPDSLCAFSSYDHDQWLTHFIGFVLQTGNGLYLLFKSWGKTYLFVAFPLFIAGSLKYGEKSWVLRSLTTLKFKTSLSHDELQSQHLDGDGDDDVLLVADFLFKRLKFLFAGIKLPTSEGERCQEQIIRLNSPQKAFRAVELQFGLLYDLLYTKAIVIYSKLGILVRCFSFLASVSALVTFWCVGHQVDNSFDLSVTYVLLWGAFAMESLGLILLITSDWTKLWLLRPPKSKLPLFDKLVNELSQGKRWSRKIKMFNLIHFCIRYAKLPCIIRIIQLAKDKFQDFLGYQPHNQPRQHVDAELLELIYNHLEDRIGTMISNTNPNESKICKKLLNYRGDFVLQKFKCLEDLSSSTVAVEFDHSLLLWHIATDICYYDDVAKTPGGVDGETLKKYSKISNCLSDYMLYLLDMHPDSLPKHTDQRRYKEAKKEVIQFFKTKGAENMEKAVEKLLQQQQEGVELGAAERKSILFDGCKLAAQLQSLKPPNMENWGCKEKWEMMNVVWVELLTYAAAHCGWEQHIQHLRMGGELITHVCLLMANLGLSPQYYS